MVSLSCSFPHIFYLILLSCFILIIYDFVIAQPLCHYEERSALLQFKQSFVIDMSDSTCSGTILKLTSWKVEGGNGNCCSWDGIECDNNTGYVVGLDLSSSCMYGSIHSNSSLFQLVHLQKLNLAYNNFNYSNIPSRMGQLSELRFLSLSSSTFSGQIPATISKLHKLSVLDLSDNVDTISGKSLLELKNPDLSTLIVYLTGLEVLNLDAVVISSPIPDFLANFSSLEVLSMRYCELNGKFSEKIFQLQNLREISVVDSLNLYGYLPEFNFSNSLEHLELVNTGFYGKLPVSIGNLVSLSNLNLANCNFSGSIPFSIGNLIKLTVLDLSGNKFIGSIPCSLENLTKLEFLQLEFADFSEKPTLSWLSKQSKLTSLSLLGMKLLSNTLSPLDNLTKLEYLYISHNQMSSHFPPTIHNLSSLIYLEMSNNNMIGMLPEWLGNFSTSLQMLLLHDNVFKGSIPDTFGKKNKLAWIDLSNNQLQGKVPRSLSNCEKLQVINLRRNQLNDVFPSWLGTLPNLRFLVLQSNHFHGVIGEPRTNSEFPKLHIIDLSHNYFSGNLPSKYISNWNSMKTFSSQAQYLEISVLFSKGEKVFPIFYSVEIAMVNKHVERDYTRIVDVVSFIDLSCNRFDGQIPHLM